MNGTLSARRIFQAGVALSALSLSPAGFMNEATADIICQRTRGSSKHVLRVVEKSCPSGYTRRGVAPDPFGDGTCGDLVLDEASDVNRVCSFGNVTVPAGTTVTVPSGTEVRCTGQFINNGTITVSTAAKGANRQLNSSSQIDGGGSDALPGNAPSSAPNGSVTGSTDLAEGGEYLDTVTFSAATITRPGVYGGGGGGASWREGGSGGGTLLVLCKGIVTNNGQITADGGQANIVRGAFGGGGGAGGVVVLGSAATVRNFGVVSARGAAGRDSANNIAETSTTVAVGPGGGGAGGIIHYIGATISNAGLSNVTGGAAGAVSDSSLGTATVRAGGGAGGSSAVAAGGRGGDVDASTGIDDNAAAGSEGVVMETQVEPTFLY